MFFTCVNESQEINLGNEIEKGIDRHLSVFPFDQKDLAYIFGEDFDDEDSSISYIVSSSSSQYSTCGSEIDENLGTHNKSSKTKFSKQRLYIGSANIPPHASSKNAQITAFRHSLPVWNLKRKILTSIKQYPVTLITGGTGCGKTTQVPQFLLEDAAENSTPIQIMCTQPRRLPAISIAKRVALERGEMLGDTIGYHIRLEQRISSKTALTYCTSGVLLRKLTNDELASDITHVILDEVHERETNTDYLLIVLRWALSRRPDLRVVLMSATMGDNINKFLKYFENQGICHIDVPSRLFNVDCFFLPEIIALTGYQSNSSFGMFNNNKSNTNGTKVKEEHFSIFQPSQFTTTPAFDPFESSNVQDPFGYEDSNNVMNPFAYADNSNKFDSFAYENGNKFNSSPMCNSNSSYIDQLLVDRPSFADKTFLFKFRVGMRLLPQKAIVDKYLDSGGRQWRDSVDIDLVVATLKYLIDSSVQGAIIVFLPGYEEICNVYYRIMSIFEDGKFNFEPVIFTLHSQINMNAQQKVFERVKEGQRKVDDIVFVVDSGKAKEKSYDSSTHVARLNIRWIAQSNAEQRKGSFNFINGFSKSFWINLHFTGRAGRCQSGYCFRLYTMEDYEKMEPSQLPEIKRTAIHEVCLHAKMSAPGGLSVQEFLKQAPDPPDEFIVERSMEFLELLGALQSPQSWEEFITPSYDPLDDNNYSPTQRNPNHRNRGTFYQNMSRSSNISPKSRIHYNFEDAFNDNFPKEADITEIGKIITHLPLEPQLARLLLFGLAFKCLNPITTLVAAVSYRDPFLLTIGNEDDKKRNALIQRDKLCKNDLSDHLMLIRLFNAYESEPTQYLKEKFCDSYLVSEQAMRMIHGIKKQLIYELKRCHLIPDDIFRAEDDQTLNKYSDSWPMVQAVIVAGSYPNIGVGKSSLLHASSSLKKQLSAITNSSSNNSKRIEPEYFVFHEAIAKDDNNINQHSIKIVTAVPQLAVLLFAGPIRMAAEALAHFEIVDPTGDLQRKRQLIRAEKISKWKEQREAEMRIWSEQNIIIHIDDHVNDVFKEDELPSSLQDDEFLQLDKWFGFRGKFNTLQRVIRLRCRIMDLLIRSLTFGQNKKHDEPLLDCLNQILCIAHKSQGFNSVMDLARGHSQRKTRTVCNSNRNSFTTTTHSGSNIRRI
uniref:Helicase ATP-binding domain-containing protein n=1 Tax=Meloidogyne hapla TaxID=6305 RepID=A0A1I8BYJ8_MELHA